MNNRALFKQLIVFKYQSIIDYNVFVENNVKKSIADIEKQYEEFIGDNPVELNSTDEEFLEYHMSYIDDLAYESQKLSVEIIQKTSAVNYISVLFTFRKAILSNI